MNQLVKKRFDIQVTASGVRVTDTFTLDKLIKKVKGLMLTSDKDDLLYYRGSQKIEINKQEVFPEKYESRLLMSGLNTDVNKRYYEIGDLPAGNGQVSIEFADHAHSRVGFEPYRVSLYLLCEITPE
jgi:hypothetical protein